jgi:uncharacterized protein
MHEALKSSLPQVVSLMKSHRVKRAYAFGSVVKGSFEGHSDIDLLITFDDNIDPVTYGELYFDLAEQLETLLKRPVDLITELSLRNPYFIAAINKTKVLLYE